VLGYATTKKRLTFEEIYAIIYVESNMEKTNNETFKTKDLYLAAVLKTLGHKVISLGSEPNRLVKYFTFDSLAAVEDDINKFWSNELRVMAKDLYDNIKALKDWLRAVNTET